MVTAKTIKSPLFWDGQNWINPPKAQEEPKPEEEKKTEEEGEKGPEEEEKTE